MWVHSSSLSRWFCGRKCECLSWVRISGCEKYKDISVVAWNLEVDSVCVTVDSLSAIGSNFPIGLWFLYYWDSIGLWIQAAKPLNSPKVGQFTGKFKKRPHKLQVPTLESLRVLCKLISSWHFLTFLLKLDLIIVLSSKQLSESS